MLQTAWSWKGGGLEKALRGARCWCSGVKRNPGEGTVLVCMIIWKRPWSESSLLIVRLLGDFQDKCYSDRVFIEGKRRLPWFTSKENRKYFQVITGVNPRKNPNNVSQEAASWWLHVYFFVSTTSQILYSYNFVCDSPSTQPSIDIYEQLPLFQPRTLLAWVKIWCSFALISSGEWKW